MTDFKCILDDYRKGDHKCGELCTHRIILHGLDGKSGRVGRTGVPRHYQYVTPKNSPVRKDKPEIYRIVDAYVDSFKTGNVKSLYFWSTSPGTGKTTTASAIMNAWIVHEYLESLRSGVQPKEVSTVFLDVNSFQTQYNLHTMADDAEGMESIREQIRRTQLADFAVLDDIGVRSASESFRSYLHDIINYRVTNELPTVYTSNFDIDEMKNVYDARLYDRIREQCIPRHFDGESHRGVGKK